MRAGNETRSYVLAARDAWKGGRASAWDEPQSGSLVCHQHYDMY